VPVLADPAAAPDVAALARAIAAGTRDGGPGGAEAGRDEIAQRIAEAQLDLVRVRRARHDMIAGALADPDYVSPATAEERARLLERAIDLANRQEAPLPGLDRIIAVLRDKPQGPAKLALILADLAPRLAAMDRYERRARSRRKRAIRDYDTEWLLSLVTQP
jgi:hypothetical protein